MQDGKSRMRLAAVAAAAYALFTAFLVIGLRFDPVASDALAYWNDSFAWRAPFGSWWVPGYGLALALLRGLTADSLPPVAILLAVAGASYVVAVLAVHALALRLEVREPFCVALAFAFFPLTGLVYASFPNADTPTIALLLLACLFFERREWPAFTICGALALVFQKIAWFFFPPLALAAFVHSREARPIVPLAAVPLAVWMVAGGIHTGDPLFFMRWSVENLFASRTALPVLDGLVGPFLAGSPIKIAKGLVVLALLAAALFALVRCARGRFWPGVSISAGFVLMTCLVNSYEIFSLVRYGRLLVIPVAYAALGPLAPSPRLGGRRAAILFFAVLVLSNLAFGWYLRDDLAG